MRLDPSWLVAAAPRGIVCVRETVEIVFGLDAPFDALAALVDELAAGADAVRMASAAGTSQAEARRALATLAERRVFVERASSPAAREAPRQGVPLVEAVLRVARGEKVSCAWTADEVLLVPEGADARTSRRAVRAFVAGMLPDARLEAYAAVASHERRSVVGDVPDGGTVDSAVATARAQRPADIHVLSLRDGARWTIRPEHLDRLGMARPHRLGPLLDARRTPAGPPLAGRRESWVAEYAVGNLASPWPRAFRIGRGTDPSGDRAQLVARAEAAERFGAYEVDRSRLRHATVDQLDAAAVAPDRLQRFSARQYDEHADLAPYRADEAISWMSGATAAGDPRWVPAEAVHVGLRQPGAPHVVVSSSSGLAAGGSPAAAADGAVREVIERDAFMWTWVQRVSRERIDPRDLDPAATALARAVTEMGYEVSLVNLTLDTKPVIMAVLHTDTRMHVAAACREDPREAAAKALDETALVLALEHPHEPPSIRAQDVETPEDHMWLHLRAEAVERASFLWGSSEVVALADVAAVPGPAPEAVGEVVLVDLTTPRTAPFHVARALVPGLVPISFGWDREALGMPRLAQPARTVDGRTLGRALDLAGGPPILPHPFP